MTSHKSKSNSNIVLLLTAAVVIIASVYFWRKKANAGKPNCQEICFSTSPSAEQDCDIICTPPAVETPASEVPLA